MNKWNSKRIAFVSILIAMSISFVVIGAQFFAISSFPSIKLSLAGLPVKIVGFLFGPLTGLFVGITTDFLAFVFVPIFIHPLYSVALGITGMLPGFFALVFNLIYKNVSNGKRLGVLEQNRILYDHYLRKALLDKDQIEEAKFRAKIQRIDLQLEDIKTNRKSSLKLNVTLIVSIVLILTLLIVVSFVTWFAIPQEGIDSFVNSKNLSDFFKNKITYLILIWIGVGSSIVLLIIGRFKMKESTFFEFSPILLFVLLTEYINLPIIAMADKATIELDFTVSYISSLMTSPIKIWLNLIVIPFAIKIVLPLIEKKTFNGYV